MSATYELGPRRQCLRIRLSELGTVQRVDEYGTPMVLVEIPNQNTLLIEAAVVRMLGAALEGKKGS